jgi:hypothetical protein
MKQTILPTYKAILRGDRLEWRGNVSRHLPADRPVAVYVTVLDEPAGDADTRVEDQGVLMAGVLERLAEICALADITDAVTWEHEIRQERPLPGRDA